MCSKERKKEKAAVSLGFRKCVCQARSFPCDPTSTSTSLGPVLSSGLQARAEQHRSAITHSNTPEILGFASAPLTGGPLPRLRLAPLCVLVQLVHVARQVEVRLAPAGVSGRGLIEQLFHVLYTTHFITHNSGCIEAQRTAVLGVMRPNQIQVLSCPVDTHAHTHVHSDPEYRNKRPSTTLVPGLGPCVGVCFAKVDGHARTMIVRRNRSK
jgi:hypothetical protein